MRLVRTWLCIGSAAWAVSAAAAPGAGLDIDPAQALAGTPTVGAVTMLPGETYHGPGPITVGYLGAKKQLVLPSGAWVLLAVADRSSRHATPVPMVSMVFGQFSEGRLASLLGFTFSSRIAGPQNGWSDATACLQEPPPRQAQRVTTGDAGEATCGWTQPVAASPAVDDAAWQEALRVVPRLGAVLSAPRQYTRAWATDRKAGYLSVRRLDHEATHGQQPTRVQWLQAYLPFLRDGLYKAIGATELEPGVATPPRIRVTLPD